MLRFSRYKSILFRFLNVLPGRISYPVYHKLQELLRNKDLELATAPAIRTFDHLLNILEDLKIDIKGKTFLEIGSGWLPILPYCIKFIGGANEVNTYDLNRHFSKFRNKKFHDFFSKKFKKNLPPMTEAYGLPLGINYFPYTNLIYEELNKPDIVFSRFVLEHVTPGDLMAAHRKFKRELIPGSYIVHFISPSDHRAYDDKDLSLQDFLKYSEEEWNRIQTRFDYHNRWRLPQYLDLFKELEFEIVYLTYDVPPKNAATYQKFLQLEIHPDFSRYSNEELTAGSIVVVLKT